MAEKIGAIWRQGHGSALHPSTVDITFPTDAGCGAMPTPPVFEFALFFVAPTMPAPFFALMNKPKVLVADPR